MIPATCIACGDVIEDEAVRAPSVCDECRADTREDDHDVHTPNMASRAVDA